MKIFGIILTRITQTELLEKVLELKKQTIIFTPNPEILLKIITDNEFRNILEKANYLTPDGIGIFIAYQILSSKQKSKIIQVLKLPIYISNLFLRRKYLYKKYGERICGSDLTKEILKELNIKGEKITIIDLHSPQDDNKVKYQKIFKTKLKEFYNNIEVDYHIYDESKKEEIIEKIRSSKSKILFSTLGMKKQEKSIIEIAQKCNNIKLALGIGSSFDYFTGFQKELLNLGEYFEWNGFIEYLLDHKKLRD